MKLFLWSQIFFFLNWRIFALQNFVVFCRVSAWINHRYTYAPPSWTFWKDLYSFPFYYFPLLHCIVHSRNSAFTIFSFLLCFLLLFFSQLFVKPPQTTTLFSCISFSLGWFWSLPPVQCYEPVHSSSSTSSTRYNPLNIFVTSTV